MIPLLLSLLLFVPQIQNHRHVFAAGGGGGNCSACSVDFTRSTDSGGSGVHNDPTSYFGGSNTVLAGQTLVVFHAHDHWTTGATSTITGSCSSAGGAEIESWQNGVTGAAGSTTTDTQFATSWGINVFVATNATACAGIYTMTVQPSVCVSSTCSVGGSYIILNGPHSWDAGSAKANGTTSGASNRAPCGSLTASQTSDFLLGSLDNTAGTFSAGTSPIAFTMETGAHLTTANEWNEGAIWSSSGAVIPTFNASATGLAYGCVFVAFK